MSRNRFSIVEYHSRQERNRCGYCRSPNTSYSHGMSAQLLSVQDYQNLIDRGWRRSGSYCYKPIMDVTCCPHYTIKCEALDFKISKSQRKILKRMIKFLKNELKKDEEKASRFDPEVVISLEIPDFPQCSEGTEKDVSKMQVTSVSEELAGRLDSNIDSSESSTNNTEQLSKNVDMPSSSSQSIGTSNIKPTKIDFDPTRAPQRKAKLIRIERKRNKLLAQGKTLEEIDAIMSKRKQQNPGKSLEDYFDEINNCPTKLELRLVRTSPMSKSYKNTAKTTFELYKKYQMKIHGDNLDKLTEDRYSRFLVRSPFREWKPENGPPQGYGSFHEQYWLNDTLIAVAVIDILPSCISSVYFFYDPTYSYLSLGTFSSLREVLLTRQLNKYASNLKFYYMGYYIHTCVKMRYKAKMTPSKLLCPETYVWCSIEKCLPKLDVAKYSRLNEDLTAKDEDGIVDISQALILFGNKAMHYGVWRSYFPHKAVDDNIQEYALLVGKKCALSMLYYIDD